MDPRTASVLFSLLRSAIRGTPIPKEQVFSSQQLQEVLTLAEKHDMAHLAWLGFRQNNLIPDRQTEPEKSILMAVFRHERTQFEYEALCQALEQAKIPFLPLKGSVLKAYYPEAWMRTSCDIDILVHQEDLERAILFLSEHLHYKKTERATHDVSLFSPSKVHIELHFDLVEEGRAKGAIAILRDVWSHSILRKNSNYQYEMSDAYFYFYHIAHMAKHFENGGCGIRPFLDLWILDRMEQENPTARDALLSKGGLLTFAQACRSLSHVWFDGVKPNSLSLQMQDFLLSGGSFGSTGNRVVLQQTNKGGKFGYLLSRVFIPFEKLKRYYPILEKHPSLMPIMQVRRWFMLLDPNVAKMAKSEIYANTKIEKTKADQMNRFLDQIGLK